MARGLLRLSLRPRLRLIPTTMVDTMVVAWATMAVDMDMVTESATTAVDTVMDTATATTARGLLRLSPRPRLRLIPTTMVDTMAMDWATTAVDSTAVDTMAVDTVMDTATATTDKLSLPYLFLAQPPHIIVLE